MAKYYYLECEAGVAGDMLVASMLDIGADEQELLKVLNSLPLSGYEIKISRVKKSGIDACDFDVIVDDPSGGLDHDMEYLHGSTAHHHHDHDERGSEHDHHHDHEEDGHHHHHHHIHRHLSDIHEIIDAGQMTDNARTLAKKIFDIVAQAESKAHGIPVEEVHFHEVGAIDSIVDIVSIAVCADNLGLEGFFVPYLCEGMGTVRCMHGVIPVPVPAVTNIVQDNDIPLKRINIQGEFVTPTGAAAVAALRITDPLPSSYRITKTGIGAGKRSYERASMVRLMEIELGQESSDALDSDFVWRLETDIDDMTGERFGYVMDRLYGAGAREVHFSQVQMKKNRPGTELVVICDDSHRRALEEIIFFETTSIGIRRVKMARTILPRTRAITKSEYGSFEAKCVTMPDGSSRIYPEYEEVCRLVNEQKISFFEAWELMEAMIRGNQ